MVLETYTMIVVVFTKLYIFVKTHLITLKSVNFTTCKLYLNKTDFFFFNVTHQQKKILCSPHAILWNTATWRLSYEADLGLNTCLATYSLQDPGQGYLLLLSGDKKITWVAKRV